MDGPVLVGKEFLRGIAGFQSRICGGKGAFWEFEAY